MEKNEIIAAMMKDGVNIVLSVKTTDKALKVAEAIEKGGVNIVEVPMFLKFGMEILKKISDEFGDRMLVGAGTVLDDITARQAILQGAKFVVGPVFNRALMETCSRYSIVSCPGALTPSEIVSSWEMGADIVKVFPAYSLGGAKYIKTLKGPLPHISLMVSGGVSFETAGEYIKAGASCITIGGAIVDKKAVANDDYDVITQNTKKILSIVREARKV